MKHALQWLKYHNTDGDLVWGLTVGFAVVFGITYFEGLNRGLILGLAFLVLTSLSAGRAWGLGGVVGGGVAIFLSLLIKLGWFGIPVTLALLVLTNVSIKTAERRQASL
jgi:hypothetical protein